MQRKRRQDPSSPAIEASKSIPRSRRASTQKMDLTGGIAKTPSTLAEVARMAGFSTATVSRTFNEPQKVSPEVRERIQHVAEMLRYRPNRLVSGVLRGRVPILGAVLNVLNAAFMPELLGGIFEACEEAGYSCLVYDSAAQPEREVNALKLCIQHRLAGILLFPLDQESHKRNQVLAEIDELGVPVVALMSPASAALDAPLVGNDDYRGALEAVTHLIELGHRNILHLSGSATHYRSSDERLRGYQDAHIRAGLPIPEGFVRTAGFGLELETWRILEELEASPGGRRYTAIFAASDYVACRAIQFFQNREVRIPQEISIIGFGDLPISELSWPPLTTVNQDFRRVGATAGAACLGLAQPQPLKMEFPQLVSVRLVIRNSTAPPPSKPA